VTPVGARDTRRGFRVRTFSPKADDITRSWYVIDAEDMVLGRLATEVASRLRGKHKPIFAPHVDTGDHIVVVNAAKVVLTSDKSEKKFVYHHSGYPGGLTKKKYGDLLSERPEEVVRRAVRGMLPRTRLGRQQLLKLKVYAGAEHPHQAQQPEPLDVPGARAPS
jgi:large subunit ribosomal protein L13